MLIADVQVMCDLAAERVVIRALRRFPEKAVVVARELAETERSAAADHAGRTSKRFGLCRVGWAEKSVFCDVRLDKGGLCGVHRNRHGEPAKRREIVDVEMRSLCEVRNHSGSVGRRTGSGVLEIVELRRGEALRTDNPRSFQRADLQSIDRIRTGRRCLCGTE